MSTVFEVPLGRAAGAWYMPVVGLIVPQADANPQVSMDQVTFVRGVVGVLPVLSNAVKETVRPASMAAAAVCASSVT